LLFSNFRIRLEPCETPEGNFNGAVFGEHQAGNKLFCLSAPRKAGHFIELNRADLTISRGTDNTIWRVRKRRDSKIYLILSSRPSYRNRQSISGTILAPTGQIVKRLDYARSSYTTGTHWDVALLQAQPGDIFATRISAAGRARYHFYLVARTEVIDATAEHFADAYRKQMRILGRSPSSDPETFLSDHRWCDIWNELPSCAIQP